MPEEKIFKLKGEMLAIVDWANVYGWTKKLKWQIDPKKLFDYLKTYPEIYDIRFYFGAEKGNKKSEEFQGEIKRIGYNLISKEVKWVPLSLEVTYFKSSDGKIKSIAKVLGKEANNLFKELLQKKIPEALGGKFYRRKCDFDVEITRDVLLNMEHFDGLILFSGDGDYAALIDEIIKKRKQAIVVFARGCKGREFEDFKRGLFLCSVDKLENFIRK